MKGKYIAALDQGTTSCRTIIFNQQMEECGRAQQEFNQYFPRPGWVEHDAEEIWNAQFSTLVQAIKNAQIESADLACIGITNQRETTVIWDKRNGHPIHHAIVWQDRRTSEICNSLEAAGHLPMIKEKTGLLADAYFSASKIQWLLENVEGARELAAAGHLLFGTIDSWLIWKLTNGATHATDHSNASRTLLYQLHSGDWDTDLCTLFQVPLSMLPEIKDSNAFFGSAEIDGCQVPIYGVAGDQQAALYGQGCVEPGMAKNTYGTGCFMLMNIGDHVRIADSKLLTTVAWSISGKRSFALEGSVFSAGSVIQWLRDQLGIIAHVDESAQVAYTVSDTAGVYFVPAFTGLGAPYWDANARGTISGLTRGSHGAHIVRAALESIAYQSADVLLAMQLESGLPLTHLLTDGGATDNEWLMQFQADILQKTVRVAAFPETTALGVALLASTRLADMGSFQPAIGKVYNVKMDKALSERCYNGWHTAVASARGQSSNI